MTIKFRIDNGHHILLPRAAVITPNQLGSLHDLLAEQSMRLDTTLLLAIHGITGNATFEFEARVCPLALGVVSKCFDHDAAVIAVLGEAQFLGRRVRILQAERRGDIRIGLATNPDAAPELEVANANTLTLLESLGLDRESAGVLPMTELRQRLMDPGSGVVSMPIWRWPDTSRP